VNTETKQGSSNNESATLPTLPTTAKRLMVKTAEACELLGGISRTTLWRLEKRGLIKASRHSRNRLYSIEHLKRFAEGTAK
jgi:hypothetical protein